MRPPTSFLTGGMAALDLLAVTIAVAVVAGLHYSAAGALVGGLGAGATMTVVVAVRGGYRSRHWDGPRQDLRALFTGIGAAGAVAVCLAYFGLVDLPQQVLLTGAVAGVGAAMLTRAVHQLLLRMLQRSGSVQPRVLLVGPAQGFEALHQMLARGGPRGPVLLGRCGPGASDRENGAQGTGSGDEGVLGTMAEAPGLVRELAADTVVVAANALRAEELRQLSWRLEPLGVSLLVAPDVAEVEAHRTELVCVDGIPMMRIALGPSRTTMIIKAFIDRCLGVVLGLMALLVLLPATVAVKVTSPGPTLFRQQRAGEDGVPFTMVKLRTMYIDAEERLVELMDQNDGNSVLFKMRRDPRVTPVGRILRRLSIDELPQLWNVIRGDMSLVGPRPPLPQEVAEYDDRAYHRLSAKPGLTGLWQVSGRSDLDWEETVRLDLRYVDNRSAPGDLRILVRTAGAVLGGRGAY